MGGDGESVALMWVMVSRVGTYPQTHGSVYVNYVQLFTCHHTSIKWLIKKKKTYLPGGVIWNGTKSPHPFSHNFLSDIMCQA